MASYMQRNGINIILNVTWSLPDSYDYSFSGVPTHSTIAINSNGANQDEVSKNLWYKGYWEAMKRLQPTCIVRFGPKMEGEMEDISVFYNNEVLDRMHYGRKRK